MRTLVRSAVAFVAIAMTLAAGSAAAYHATAANVPVNCKNPAECSTKLP